MLPILSLVLSPRDALNTIYALNGGSQWVGATNWNTSASICVWKGIQCNPGGIVTGMNLSGFGLTGSLADVFDSFPQLKELYLNDNFLVSALPSTFCKLTALQFLDISNAGFTGALPTCFCKIQFLMYFKATYNAFNGQLPQCLPQMAYLRSFDISCNNMNGTVPNGMQNLQYLTVFNIECNANFTCEGVLSNKAGVTYQCGMEDCDDCTVPTGKCPAIVTVEDCGAYQWEF